ncbi:unnamed protein product [Cochlearia groenlandica]
MAKKAVLIGINYHGTEAALKGCINDVKSMHKSLVELYGFTEENIIELIDTDTSKTQPTGKNIREALSDLVGTAKSGDVLFVHYSGHGTRLPSETGEEDDTGFDECIVPSDINYITDDDIREIVNKVPKDCSFTFVSDSCHSGGLIDSAKEQIGESFTKNPQKKMVKCPFELFSSKATTSDDVVIIHEDAENKTNGNIHRFLPIQTSINMLKQATGKDDIRIGNIRTTLFDAFREDASPKVKKFLMKVTQVHKEATSNVGFGNNGVVLLSGCQTDQFSADVGSNEKAFGAFTNSIQVILGETKGKISYKDLVSKSRELLEKQGYQQRPGLYCTDGSVDAPFIC